MTTAVTLHPDIAEYIGDGSAHAEDMPGYASSILDEIAKAQREYHALVGGIKRAYRVVLRHRFTVRYQDRSRVRSLIDTWTGDDLAFYYGPTADQATEQMRAANERNADVFVARIDRDIAEGGL